MKGRILTSLLFAGMAAFVGPSHSAPAAVPKLPDIIASWDPVQDARVTGYRLYMGLDPKVYIAHVDLSLNWQLHGICEHSIWFHTPKIYVAVSWYQEAELFLLVDEFGFIPTTPILTRVIVFESAISDEVEWPIS